MMVRLTEDWQCERNSRDELRAGAQEKTKVPVTQYLTCATKEMGY